MLRPLPALLAPLAALAAAGCGGSSNTSPADRPAPLTQAPAGTKTAATSSGGSVTVSMRNIAFQPKEITVPVGKKVVWVNDDNVGHNVTADSGASFRSDTFGKGGRFVWVARKPGKVTYECTIHPGMTGTITVTPPPSS